MKPADAILVRRLISSMKSLEGEMSELNERIAQIEKALATK